MTDILEFRNRIKVKIYGPNIEIEDADMNFEATFTDEKDPNECTLRIYNLTDEHMNQIIKDCKYVEIYTSQYGVKDENGQLLWQRAFEGLPKDTEKKSKPAYSKKRAKKGASTTKVKYLAPSIQQIVDDADDYLEIILQEGNGADIGTFVSKSYKTGFNVKKILTDLAKSIGMEIVFDKNVRLTNVTFPIIIHDNVRNSLTKVASYIGCTASIQNNTVYVSSKNPEGVIIYYQFDEDNTQQPKYLQDKKIEFSAPYLPVLAVNGFVKLMNKRQEIDGVFQIVKLENSFSNYSEECETKVTVKYE